MKRIAVASFEHLHAYSYLDSTLDSQVLLPAGCSSQQVGHLPCGPFRFNLLAAEEPQYL